MKIPEPQIIVGHEMQDPRGGTFVPYCFEIRQGDFQIRRNGKQECRDAYRDFVESGEQP